MSSVSEIKIQIDGRWIATAPGRSILDAALAAGIYIPHLCHYPDLEPIGACRLCIVSIQGIPEPLPACLTDARDGMVVQTRNDEIDRRRRLAMELMLAGHPDDCAACNKYLNCELQSLKQYLGCEQLSVKKRSRHLPQDNRNPLFIFDPGKCVVCGRCIRACQDLRGVGVLFYRKKGGETFTGTAADLPLAEAGCRFCGACAEVCPTGAIQDRQELIAGKKRRRALIPCRYQCPAEIDVPAYVRLIGEKDYAAAAAVIREKVPFPGVLGYVCHRPCEDVCRRGHINEPVSIRELKKFAALNDVAKVWRRRETGNKTGGKKIAVIGSGPCGLTAAYYLRRKGHNVTVYESLPEPGGMLRYGIPPYRLPREVLDKEIEEIAAAGVNILTGKRVETIAGLLQDGFQAVLIAIGTHRGRTLAIPGASLPGVLVGVDFLRDVNSGRRPPLGERVVVLGGGSVAFDCARVACRLGAVHVDIACLESRQEMPAAAEEISQAEEEGITIHPSVSFGRIVGDGQRVSGVELLGISSLRFDENRQPIFDLLPAPGLLIGADTVIFAIGQQPDVPDGFGLGLSPSGMIPVDPDSLATAADGVFAAGDAVSGTSSVIQAVAAGRQAAAVIDRYLGGYGIIDERLVDIAEPEKRLGYREGFAFLPRYREHLLPVQERRHCFSSVNGIMDEEEAGYESVRCLQCDLRLKMPPVKFWGSY